MLAAFTGVLIAALPSHALAQQLAGPRADGRPSEAAQPRSTAASALPSGRTTYRRLSDYQDDLKRLAVNNPHIVKPVTLPFRTYEGRKVEGVEITTNPDARDGKPAFLLTGLHHARDWPSGEHAMEFALELVNGYNSGDTRVRQLVSSSRTIVVPVVNPDGFNISREAGQALGAGDGRGGNDAMNTVTYPQEYRRKNWRLPNDAPAGSCVTTSQGVSEPGVDPDRNYGALWGGPGADTDLTSLTYRGPGPFSEPESRNIRQLVSNRHVTTLVSNHTYSDRVLRPPGLRALGETPDEPVYKALGDAMGEQNGYLSQNRHQLSEATGTAID